MIRDMHFWRAYHSMMMCPSQHVVSGHEIFPNASAIN